MPVITVKLGAGQADEQQKKELIHQITEISSAITQIPLQSFTLFIEDIPTCAIGIGGQTLKEKRLAAALNKG